MILFFTKLVIFLGAVSLFPLVVLGQTTFSGNMNKVDGASEQTKDGLIKKCSEKNTEKEIDMYNTEKTNLKSQLSAIAKI